MKRGLWIRGWLLVAAVATSLAGCSIQPILQPANSRPFSFEHDTLAFNNETVWRYAKSEPAAQTTAEAKNPDSEYTLHCFVMSRSVRQFFQFAKFDARQPRLDDEAYRQLVKQVIAHDPRETTPVPERILIPGYADLRSFSAARGEMLKQEFGSAAESFLQRGNWRMVFPFTRGQQQESASSMLAEVRKHRPPIAHLATFPNITINHAVLLYAASEDADSIHFSVYDPNDASKPARLSFDRASQTFNFPPNPYFAGGAVSAYEVYRSIIY